MLTRRLTLKRETLTALSADEMAFVGGAADASGPTCYSCLDCIDVRPSLLAPTNCCQGIPTFHRAGGAAC